MSDFNPSLHPRDKLGEFSHVASGDAAGKKAAKAAKAAGTSTTAQDLKVGDVTEHGTVAQFGIQATGRSMRLVQFTDGTWKKFRSTTPVRITGTAKSP